MFDILRQLPLIPGSISQQDLIKLTRGPFCQAKVQIQTWMGKKSWTQIKRKAMIAKRSTQGAMIVKSWTRGAMITRRRLFCHFPEAPPVVVSSALLRPNCPNCQSVEAAAAFSSPTEQPPPHWPCAAAAHLNWRPEFFQILKIIPCHVWTRTPGWNSTMTVKEIFKWMFFWLKTERHRTSPPT